MSSTYKNSAASNEARTADLLSRMTVDEKVAQLHGLWLILSPDGDHRVRNDPFGGALEQGTLRETLLPGLGQITRPLGTRAIQPVDGVRALNKLQKFMCEETRLGIPVMSHEECLSGLMVRGATLFPSALAFGATWNPTLIEAVGRVIGDEARSIGCRQGLAPVLDVARDARWGRTEETISEDPYLTGLMATRYVQGLQGEKRDLLATLKHFAGHSLSEGGRNHAPVNLGWRELSDRFLLPFEMAVKLANAGSVMPAYHDIDGEPCHSSHRLLTELLRDEWGFDGLIVADYGGVSMLYEHHGVATGREQASAQTLAAGLDIELPGNECSRQMKSALEAGVITMETIDTAVTRVLLEKFRLGLFEHPYTDESAINLQSPKAVQLAREVAEQSVVVLDNNGILPLRGKGKIALIGPTADDPLAMLGDYSFPVQLILSDGVEDTRNVVTIRDGLNKALGPDRIVYAKGCHILEQRRSGAPVFPGEVDDSTNLSQTSPLSTSLDLIADAVAAAKSAELAIVCIGDLSGLFQTGTVGEGSDVDTISLPGVQQQLLDAVVATGTPVVAVITSGRPYVLGGAEDRLAAQVMAFFGGQEAGTALANVLTGAVEPSGRMAISIPRSAGAAPYYYNHKFKSSGTPIARHFGSRYPFGHGLSFTEFAFESLSLAEGEVDIRSGEIVVNCSIRNVGRRPGVAVPQVYVRDLIASIVQPVRELKAFGRIALAPGESAHVTFTIPTDMLAFTGADGTRIVEPGEFEIMIGASSSDIKLRTTANVTGDVYSLPRRWRMESQTEFRIMAAAIT